MVLRRSSTRRQPSCTDGVASVAAICRVAWAADGELASMAQSKTHAVRRIFARYLDDVCEVEVLASKRPLAQPFGGDPFF
ncbi:MAG: hypothetical protein ABI870_07450, partial [Rhodanobacter sp.]